MTIAALFGKEFRIAVPHGSRASNVSDVIQGAVVDMSNHYVLHAIIEFASVGTNEIGVRFVGSTHADRRDVVIYNEFGAAVNLDGSGSDNNKLAVVSVESPTRPFVWVEMVSSSAFTIRSAIYILDEIQRSKDWDMGDLAAIGSGTRPVR